MIKRKLKKCIDCGKENIIWSKNLCRNCYYLNYPEKLYTIKKQSQKAKIKNQEYLIKRKEYLLQHPICEAKIKCKKNKSTDIHHKKGRTGKLLCNNKYFLAVCRNCHIWIETHPIDAKEKGLSLNRL